ncbi:MAG: DUF559 domain-containing protein [Kineosporiaceae bacterium]|nr:DUF559 domain-containing protein [Kineosporiaceae bacterium]MBK8078630.1 DUF559 domain-containing protein [Kineosporiaceae bacterium]
MGSHRTGTPSISARQAGVFTAAQARDEGWTPDQIRHRLTRGGWQQIAGRGLAALDGPVGPWQLAWATHLTWPDVVPCRTLAGAMHGLPVHLEAPVDVYAPPGRRRASGIRVHRSPWTLDEPTTVRGLPCTSLRTTALDCLATLDWPRALDLYAWLSTRDILTRDLILDVIRSGTGRHGVPQLLRLARVVRTGAVSAAEDLFHQILRRGGLAGWAAGQKVFDDVGLIGVVDVLFRAERVVVEIDGRRAHSDARVFQQDRERQNRLLAAGYLVLRFTWWDLTQRADSVVDQIRRALSTRS